MKKILLVDACQNGHHRAYMNELAYGLKGWEVYTIFPLTILGVKKSYVISINMQSGKLKDYLILIKMVHKVVNEVNPDIVHFLTGDYIFRFAGIGLRWAVQQGKIVITFHHFRTGLVRNLWTYSILHEVDYCVVHSDVIKKQLNKFRIDNVQSVDYPYFNEISNKNPETIKKQLNIPLNKMVLGVFGAMRYDKGLDILLQALNMVESEVYILIAGKGATFDRKYIVEHYKRDINKIMVVEKFITDEEMADYINASNIIVLPYRKVFNGASGPLIEGVMHGKAIIGPNHGVLGHIIQNNKLGYIFEAENIESLSSTIEKAVNSKFVIENEYVKYQAKLDKANFINSYIMIYETVDAI